MTNAPRLLDKLVNLTAIHDIELMEFSLLKTLLEFVRPKELSILKFDRRGKPCHQLSLKQEKYEIMSDNISTPEWISSAVEIVLRTKQPFTRRLESGNLLAVWHIQQTEFQDVCLVTVTEDELSKLNAYMINGLLGIYRNFYAVLIESQRDQLTGLPNRKTFDDVINRIYNQPLPTTEPVTVNRRRASTNSDDGFWLGLADVDHFKKINDTWGHLYGDEVLLLMAQLMRTNFRESDYLFRFGGEEFVIIVRAADEEQAHLAFERFRVAVENHRFPQIGQVTISVGVTKLDPCVFSATILDHADKALYYAKHNGRNRVDFFEDLLASGLLEMPEIKTGEIELF